MSDICPVCTLPIDLCVCESIAKEDQRVSLFLTKRRFGKLATMVEGIEGKNIDMKAVAKNLKSSLACGGTYKKGVDHKVGRGKSQKNQDEDFPPPARQEALQHGDGALSGIGS